MTHHVDYKYSLRQKGKEIKALTVCALTPKWEISSTSIQNTLPLIPGQRAVYSLVEADIS